MRKRDLAWLGLLSLAIVCSLAIQVASNMAAGAARRLPPSAQPPAVAEGDIVFGRADAPATVIAFVSLTCLHCRRWEAEQMPEIQRTLVETGRLRLIVRDFPLDAAALRASALVRCLPEGDRAAAHRALLSTMEGWAGGEPGRMAGVAGLAGAASASVLSCAQGGAPVRAVLEAVRKAELDYGIRVTPSFVAGGMVVAGEQTAADLAALTSR